MNYTKTIVEYLKIEMKERNIRQSKIASDLHMSPSSLSKRLSGTTSIEFETVMFIAEYMGISIDKVFHKNQSKKTIIKIEIETEGDCKISSINI